MIPEAFSYTLTLGGRYAGTQDWVVRPDKGTVVVRVQTDFGGALPAGRKIQESRIEPETGFSLAYAEADGSSKKPQFETVFDQRSGIITLRQGKDEATSPLLVGHHDPLSLLLWLRHVHEQRPGADDGAAEPETEFTEAPSIETQSLTVRMVGGRVHVQHLPDGEVGGAPARVYFLRPGGAYVYAEEKAPHRLLRLIQPSDFGPVEARLMAEAPAHAHAAVRPAGQGQPGRPVRGQVGKPRRRGK